MIFLLLFSFLAVSFSLILIQKDMRFWEKFCLLINPALLVLVVVMLMSISLEKRACASDIAPVINVVAEITEHPESPAAKKAAEVLKKFSSAEPEKDDWKNLADELKGNPEKKTEK